MHTPDRDDYLLIDSNQQGSSRRDSLDTDRQVEAVVLRHPDGPIDVRIFIDGVETAITEFTLDAGAGWCWADWKHSRDRNLSAASPAARQAMLAAYADPPGGRYVEDRSESQWLDDVSTIVTTEEDER
ncbi:hypothetical protein [Nocardia abscessus]|uniref:hypothetical protein n=1 Tax=Nocardia abscessus TaxID=120957 RepID=UPI001D150D3C|nr:hypothetical protein [Nocardia abscessus]MCC3329690.1 hypothetical protein [Nocardia abscessus]